MTWTAKKRPMTAEKRIELKTPREHIQENWDNTLDRVRRATADANRSVDEVQIVGVSKYVDAETTSYLIDAGCDQLGENRPQMLWQKAEALGWHSQPPTEQAPREQTRPGPRWHMIGHLQTNKLRRILRHAPLIHSVDSERLLRAIQTESERIDSITPVLLEVNISGEDNKTGLPPNELRKLLAIDGLANVRIDGLMAMAGWGTDSKEAGQQFQAVKQLQRELQQETGLPLPELSMGMTGDFPEAIAAGATLVRIGSALFEGVM